MAIDNDVYRAILAMDSYNRDDFNKINIDSLQLGTNIFVGDNVSETPLEFDALNAGFSAQVYTWGNETVIAYKGTDTNPESQYNLDQQNGWFQGLGYQTEQSRLAIEFYKHVLTNSGIGGIELVGHSLGGGLAGYVGALFDVQATLFNNMAFELSARNFFLSAQEIFDAGSPNAGIYEKVYGTARPWAPTYGTGSALKAYDVQNDFLALNRQWQDTPVTELPQDGGLDDKQAHSQSLLTILLYGDKHENKAEWEPFRMHFLKHLFDTTIANQTLAATITNTASVDEAMRQAIAYSAIDEGTMPFGNNGIRALFDDAEDIGKVLPANPETSPLLLAQAANSIAKAVVQFAGQIAINKSNFEDDPLARRGILENVNSTVIVDLAENAWIKNAAGTNPTILAENELKQQYFDYMGGSGTLPADIQEGMFKLWGKDYPPEHFYPSNIIDRLVYRQQEGFFASSIAERVNASDKVTLFAAGNTPVRMTGHSGDDLLYGSIGNDTFFGQAGKDLLRGGDGNDELYGGSGDDYLLGGDGNDILVDIEGTNTLDGGDGDDFIIGGGGPEGDHTIIIGGKGNDTVFGYGDGYAQVDVEGEGVDVVLVGKDFGVKAGAEDYVSFAGLRLYGALAHGSDVSDSTAALDLNGAFVYMKNQANQLMIGNALGWVTYLIDYKGGPGVDHPTAHVQVEQMDWTAFRLAEFSETVDNNNIIKSICTVMNANHQIMFGEPAGVTDPLVLDLDGDGIELSGHAIGASPYFDLDGDNFAESTGWVRSDDGFLVHDINGDGQINDISELFGSATVSGFDELSTFDSNGDQIIDASDTNFASLQVWRDLNGNAVTDAGELFSLSEAGVQSIDLNDTATENPDAQNPIASTSTFTRTDGTTGEIADVNFTNNNFDTKYLGDSTVNATASALPDLKGWGVLTGLRIAMTNDAGLLATAQTASQAAPTTIEGIRQMIIPVLHAWAGNYDSGIGDLHYLYTPTDDASINVRDIAIHNSGTGAWSLQSGRAITDANGDVIDDPTLADIQAMSFSWEGAAWAVFNNEDFDFLEQYLGDDLMITPETLANPNAGTVIENYLTMLYDFQTSLGVAFAVQSGLSGFFEDVVYDVEEGTYSSTNEYQLTPLYKNILTASPQADATAATNYLNGWEPILDVFQQRFSRGSSHLANTYSFLFSNLVGAYESVGHGALSISQAASALTIPNIIEGTGDLTGTNENDIYYMGPGNQTAIGGSGPDSYVFGSSFGQDVINDSDGDDFDAIRFATYKSDEITASRDGSDLILTVTATGDSVRIVEQFARKRNGLFGGYIDPDRGVGEIVFADGVIWDIFEMARQVTDPQDGDQVYVGTRSTDYLDGGAGNDTLSGKDSLDVYKFGIGSGNDVIQDQMEFMLFQDNDFIEFGEGITVDDLIFERTGNSDDLLIRIQGTTDTILVKGQFDTSNTSEFGLFSPDRIENLAFSNGWIMRWDEVMAHLINKAQTEGNDEIFGFHHQDTFEGGLGDDIFRGGDDGDTYKFGRGDGLDTINDGQVDILTTTADKVLFDADITPEDIQLSRVGNSDDLIISIAGDTATLTIAGQFDAAETGPYGTQWFNRIEEFQFQDAANTVWTWEDVMKKMLADAKTDGDDTIHGFHYQDTLDGGAGNDTLMGGARSDTYKFGIGSGHDVIHDDIETILTDDNDRVVFGSGITLTNLTLTSANEGNDLIITINSTGETLTIKDQFKLGGINTMLSRIEEFHFADGTVMTSNDFKDIVTTGTAGDDVIYGSNLPDTMIGGAGNDTLIGKSSSDTYLIETGSGHDVIQDLVSHGMHEDNDKVVFGAGITTANVTAARSGNDLILTISGTESLTVTDCFLNEFNEIEEFHFNDGIIWTIDDVKSMTLVGTDGDDTLLGFNDRSDVLDGGLGNDRMEGKGYADTYIFDVGYGQDVIRDFPQIMSDSIKDKVVFGSGVTPNNIELSRSGNNLIISIAGTTDQLTIEGTLGGDVYKVEEYHFSDGTIWTLSDLQGMLLVGTDGADSLVGFDNRNDTLTGGLGNDTLMGDEGHDVYEYALGDGQDVIKEFGHTEDSDILRLGAGITTADITVTRSTSDTNDIIFTFASGDSITLDEQDSYTWNGIDTVEFADGTRWFKDDIVALADQTQNTYVVTHAGTVGNDSLVGSSGADVLEGDLGNDSVQGGYGSDIYLFELGDGQDNLYDYGYSIDTDKLVFGVGVAASDIAVLHSTTDTDDIILQLASGDSVLLNEQDYSTTRGIEYVEFADGTTWTYADIKAIHLSQAATSGNDTIVGFKGNDTIAGGLGNDYIQGGYGSDTYQFNLGDGQDNLYDNGLAGNTDKLVFGAGIAASDITVIHSTTDTDDITLQLASGDSVLLNEQDYSTSRGIERVEFADGTTWTYADIKAIHLSQAATSGNDTIVGFKGNDTIAGGLGNDYIQGGYGSDTYLFNLGDGQDNLYDYGLAGNTDKLVFGTGISTTDISVIRNSADTDDVTLQLSSGDSVLLNEQDSSTSRGFESIEFADGTNWSYADLQSVYFNQAATSGNDYIIGFKDADDFNGGAGNDTLLGGYGSDTYRFNIGDTYAQIHDYGMSSDIDKLVLGVGIATTDVAVTWDTTDADDIILQLTSGETIYLNEQDYLSSYGIEQVVFNDGTTWSRSDLVSMANASLAPVVLDLDGDGVEFAEEQVAFDYDSDGVTENGGWAAADDGFLVLDRNDDGRISSGSELSFVQDTPGGQTDLHGLQAYDSNSDGFLSAEDDDFGKFQIWSDKNQNGVSEANELTSLAQAGLASLDLTGIPAGPSTLETPGATVLNTTDINWTDGSSSTAADTVLKFDQDVQVNRDTLIESQLQLLIDSISSFTPSSPGFLSMPDIFPDDTLPSLASNWKRN